MATLGARIRRRQINRAQKRRALNTRRIRRKGTNGRHGLGRQMYDKRRKRKNRR